MPEYTPEQTQENRKKWIEALRSGNYTQTRNVLQRVLPKGDDPPGYCCLGVAESLFNYANARINEEGCVQYRTSNTSGAEYFETAGLTKETKAALGLDRGGPRVLIGGNPASLIQMNDVFASSFEGIARAIESQDADWDGNPPGTEWSNTATLPEEYR